MHKLITEIDYYNSKLKILKNLFYENKFNHKQIYELNSALDFFEKEFHSLDSRTSAILKSEITRITNIFVSDYNISQTFCAPLDELNFKGFSSMLNCGKIVILNMNIAEYKNLSKLISAYLKLDFQSEVMYNLSKNKAKPCAFICDEYAEYVTKTDADFFSLSREAKCINIVSTQSYSSLKNTLKDDNSVKVIIQNLINKLWFRTDDIYTIEEVQKQLGKEDKEKTSSTISENAKETYFNYITNSFNSTITHLCNDILYLYAGREISVASTKAVLGQCIILLLLAKNNISQDLINLKEEIKRILLHKEDINSLALTISKYQDVFILGKNLDYYIALEGALKLKEISYIHAEAFSSGELKHGSLALIDNKVGIIGLLTQKDVSNIMRTNLLEASSRGGNIYTFAKKELSKQDNFILNDLPIYIMPLSLLVCMQLLSFFVAKIKNNEIDTPRNLAKSVTVE